MKSKNSKKEKIIIGIVVGLLTLFLLVCIFAGIYAYLFPIDDEAFVTQDVEDYSLIYERHIPSGLIIFPKEITEQAVNTEFDFYYEETWFKPRVSIFLQMVYTPEEYLAEVERLEKVKKVYEDWESVLLRDENGTYPYPAYIAIENHGYTYEYVLLSGENQITYVYITHLDRDEMRFDEGYLPSDFCYGAPEGEEQIYYGYSLYISEIDKKHGLIDYDYDKE